MEGGASGGTLASALGMFDLPREVLAKTKDPFYLNPDYIKVPHNVILFQLDMIKMFKNGLALLLWLQSTLELSEDRARY